MFSALPKPESFSRPLSFFSLSQASNLSFSNVIYFVFFFHGHLRGVTGAERYKHLLSDFLLLFYFISCVHLDDFPNLHTTLFSHYGSFCAFCFVLSYWWPAGEKDDEIRWKFEIGRFGRKKYVVGGGRELAILVFTLSSRKSSIQRHDDSDDLISFCAALRLDTSIHTQTCSHLHATTYYLSQFAF